MDGAEPKIKFKKSESVLDEVIEGDFIVEENPVTPKAETKSEKTPPKAKAKKAAPKKSQSAANKTAAIKKKKPEKKSD